MEATGCTKKVRVNVQLVFTLLLFMRPRSSTRFARKESVSPTRCHDKSAFSVSRHAKYRERKELILTTLQRLFPLRVNAVNAKEIHE